MWGVIINQAQLSTFDDAEALELWAFQNQKLDGLMVKLRISELRAAIPASSSYEQNNTGCSSSDGLGMATHSQGESDLDVLWNNPEKIAVTDINIIGLELKYISG